MKSQELERLNLGFKDKLQEHFKYEVSLVFGDGDPYSKIVLVGEAPGKTEVELGKPFVGQAGKNLEEFINILGIEREALYITNVVKFRPMKLNPDTGRESNRPPAKEEIRLCTAFIEEELTIVKPGLVVSLGNVALRCILKDDKATIGLLHGTTINVKFAGAEFVLFPLYHPASIIYNRSLRDVYLQDLHKLREHMADNSFR
ncbi:MAG TPA: uracil-DNA glycosylase [Negativicutes bacterium]|nr:uracil-DNA glycosylase [Negativicutes bacterium]